MKRELAALAVLITLISASIWNIAKINTFTEEIGIAISKSKAAAEQLNFKNSKKLIEESLEIWQENLAYSRIFIPQTQVDETTQSFYQLLEDVNGEDILSLLPSYEAMQQRLESIRESETLSLGSIF